MLESTLNGNSADILAQNINALRQLFPEIICEDRVDFDKLRQILGDYADDTPERYNFTWNGKGRALRLAQSPSTGTLRPCKEESKDWDTTQNLYIEGDNLEVLKLLQKTYHGKVKMIYIDPPYNTGGDFVYPDDYADNLENYLRITGQRDEDGGRLSTNTEASGRYHTNWLNMMYPRLRLARNLLRDDGAVFISIDENEVTNLRKLCNEVFGEENFVSAIACINKPSGRSDDKYIATAHESIILYRKSEALSLSGFEPDDNITRRYTKNDKEGNRFREEDLRKRGSHDERTDRPNLFYPFFYCQETEHLIIGSNDDETPEGYIRIEPMKTANVEGNWRWGKETAAELISTHVICRIKNNGASLNGNT